MERNCDNCKYRDVYYNAPPCDECNFEYQRQPQKGFQNWESDAMTNADYIRSMTDEELADVFDHVQGDAFLVGIGHRKYSAYPGAGISWLDWLKKEN